MEKIVDGQIVDDVIQRRSDDNPQVALRITTGNDGDIHIAIVWVDDEGMTQCSPAARYCLSGTRSHNMLLAAGDLRKAMLKDCQLWTPEMEKRERIAAETKELMKEYFGDSI